MSESTLLIIGLISNISGSIVLAFSLGAYIRSLHLAIDAHELFIISYFNPTKPIIQVTGTDVHLSKGKKTTLIISWIGVILIVGGFICQLTAYLIK